MKFTQFILKVNNRNGVVLLNTMNESVVYFTNDMFNKVLQDLSGGHYNTKEIKNLINLEFLIPKTVKEKNLYMNALLNEWETNKNFCVHILPTTACNFKCVYCYQSGIEKQHFLDSSKAQRVIGYITEYIADKNIETATVVIHGGEPTMNWGVVPEIMQAIDSLFKIKNISYNTQIVTNGFNLSIEKAELLSKYNWNRLQVTIDGPKEIHDKRRPLLNNGGTYDRIVENLKNIQNNNLIEKISIRLNFDETNWRQIKEYLPKLKELFGTDKIVLSFGYVSDTISNTSAEEFISINGLKDDGIAKVYAKLYKEAISLGYQMPDLFMYDGMCTAKLKNALVISADGNIYKCLSGVGRQEFVVSNICKKQDLPNYLFPDMYAKCFKKKCPYIPLCNTGCRFNGYLKTGNIHSNDCKKDTLNKINKRLVKIKYLGG